MIKISFEKKSRSEKKRLYEFSKKVVLSMTVLVFLSAIFAAVIIWRNNGVFLDSYLDYVKTVGGIAILGYCAKICFENPQKIKKGGEGNDTSGISE